MGYSNQIESSDDSSCPEVNYIIDDGYQMQLTRIAQSILERPDELVEISHDYASEITEKYNLMTEHRPSAVIEKITQGVRGAYLAALYHCVGAQAAKSYVLQHEAGTLDEYFYQLANAKLEYCNSDVNYSYRGEADEFMIALTGIYDRAYDALSDDTTSQNGQIFNSLASQYGFIRMIISNAVKLTGPTAFRWNWKLHSKGPYSDYLGWQSYTETIDNCLMTTQGVHSALLHVGKHYQPDEIGYYFRQNIATVRSTATVNREMLLKIAADYFKKRSDAELAEIEYDPLSPSIFIINEHNSLEVAHPSLRKGPWNPAKSCAGLPALRTPDSTTLRYINDYHKLNDVQMTKGSCDVLTMQLIMASRIAERTIYRASFTPTNNDI